MSTTTSLRAVVDARAYRNVPRSAHRPSQRLVPRRPAPPPANAVPLDFAPPLAAGDDLTIQGRFTAFHDQHPEVYRALVTLTREWRTATGGRRVGVGMLWERLRWETALAAGPDAEPYRLNNVYRARYARLIMATEPDLADAYETRELRSA